MVEVPHCPSPRRVLVGLQVELGRGRLHPEIPVGTAQRAQPRGGPARGARGLSFQGSTRNGRVGALRAPGRPRAPSSAFSPTGRASEGQSRGDRDRTRTAHRGRGGKARIQVQPGNTAGELLPATWLPGPGLFCELSPSALSSHLKQLLSLVVSGGNAWKASPENHTSLSYIFKSFLNKHTHTKPIRFQGKRN